MNVLVIPAWYPTSNSGLTGTFFREQALNMNPEDNVKILYIEQISIRRNPLKWIFKKTTLITPPIGIKFSILNLPILGRYFGYLKAYNFLKKEIKNNWKPNIIRAHGTIWAGYYAVKLGKKFNIPTIITEHRNPFILDNFFIYDKKCIKFAVENTNVFTGDGHFALRSVLLHGFSPRYCDVVGNLVNDELFKISNKGWPEIFSILTVTSLNGFYKDFKTFLNSIFLFSTKYNQSFKCDIIILEKELPLSIKELLLEYNLCDKLNFHFGGISREKLPEFYNNSSVFISTSITENFGVAMVEALMSGIPVISTRNGGAEDFVNSNNGFLTNIKDVEGITNSILKIANNEVKFEKNIIRDSVINKYGNKAFNSKLYELIEKAIKNN